MSDSMHYDVMDAFNADAGFKRVGITKKERRCEECRGIISAGTRAMRVVYRVRNLRSAKKELRPWQTAWFHGENTTDCPTYGYGHKGAK